MSAVGTAVTSDTRFILLYMHFKIYSYLYSVLRNPKYSTNTNYDYGEVCIKHFTTAAAALRLV